MSCHVRAINTKYIINQLITKPVKVDMWGPTIRFMSQRRIPIL
jgi:hypothetical protein